MTIKELIDSGLFKTINVGDDTATSPDFSAVTC